MTSDTAARDAYLRRLDRRINTHSVTSDTAARDAYLRRLDRRINTHLRRKQSSKPKENTE